MRASQPHINAGIGAILSCGHSNNQGKGWRVQELGFGNKSGHKLEDFKKMLEDIKELWGVLTATHGYSNKMTEGKQLCNNHDKTGKMDNLKNVL